MQDKADFYYVYIMEAHPKDSARSFGDKVSGEWNIKKPKSQEERIANAKNFQTKTKAKVTMLVDNFEDEANEMFAAWTERFYILQGSKVAYCGGEYDKYSVKEMAKELDKIVAEMEKTAGSDGANNMTGKEAMDKITGL